MTRRRGRCADCGREGLTITGPRPDGAGVCGACYRVHRPKARCEECGALRFPAVRANGRSGSPHTLCSRCYRAKRPQRVCDGCGRLRKINSGRVGHAELSLCTTCYIRWQSPVTCGKCGQLAPPAAVPGGRTGTALMVCARCYEPPERPCGVCGRTRRTSAKATADHPDLCLTCNQAATVTCRACGRTARGRRTGLDGRPGCFACILADRLTHQLTGPDGRILPALLPLREAILATGNPQAALSNLGRSSSRAHPVLTDLAAGRLPLTHAALDSRGTSRSIDYLRVLLVAAGALPDRDEHLHRLETFARTLTTAAHPDDRQLIALFARTHVLRRLRRNLDGAPLQPGPAYRARAELAAASHFLTHLRHQDRTPATCRQSDLDAWLDETRRADSTRAFWSWATRTHHMPNLDIPTKTGTEPSHFTPDDHRWALARRMLADDTIPDADRTAALLILLFAQHLTTISRLTRGDLHHTPQGTTELTLGPTRVVLPEPLADLINRLPTPRADRTADHLHNHDWLFPGRHPGKPLHPTSLARRLTTLGIDPRPDRNAALLDYARQLPPPVIGRLLGLAPGTVDRWATIAGGKWARYTPPRPT
ncbi:hypothetical protein [Actinomadura harenae]|uniref:Uncharacterized protein n=1 Tax=Actinomadura harenae TaxID=2483351 RepID=A0A3M2MD58_9ACTN|nr:hypothetical protein [Actinomadura harenae]RMI47396.1 hypothetical protein EBO15_02455 [Actinomadura harenae]